MAEILEFAWPIRNRTLNVWSARWSVLGGGGEENSAKRRYGPREKVEGIPSGIWRVSDEMIRQNVQLQA